MWPQVLIALELSASNVLIDSLGSYGIFIWIVHAFRKRPTPTLLRGWSMMVRVVVGLLLLHALEVAVWAQFYIFRQLFPNAETAYYYSITSLRRSAMATLCCLLPGESWAAGRQRSEC